MAFALSALAAAAMPTKEEQAAVQSIVYGSCAPNVHRVVSGSISANCAACATHAATATANNILIFACFLMRILYHIFVTVRIAQPGRPDQRSFRKRGVVTLRLEASSGQPVLRNQSPDSVSAVGAVPSAGIHTRLGPPWLRRA